jgi:surface polysaccharide O-acyltransferase-like enzyme
MTASAGGSTGRVRYDGLDLFRPLSIFGVVVVHFPRLSDFASEPGFGFLMRLRECAFPVIILTSYFVITRSLLANPGRTFGQFASKRFVRLAVPCAIWSAFYWLMWEVAGPVLRGASASWPPPSLALSAYGHLWFLQFLFFGSLIMYPAVRAVTRHTPSTGRDAGVWAAAFAAAAAGYWMWGRTFLAAELASALGEQADLSLRVAVGQSIAYAEYTLLGVAAALGADVIAAFYRWRPFKAVTLVVAAAACALHVSAATPTVSRAIYSLAVFVALLRPWPPNALGWLRPVARYSYPIYIIHPAAAQVVVGAFAGLLAAPSILGLAAGSTIVFALSCAAAIALRMLLPADWFLPLVPAAQGGAGAGMR